MRAPVTQPGGKLGGPGLVRVDGFSGGGAIISAPPPIGFFKNGAANTAVKAQLLSATGRQIFIGDSIQVGEGSGAAGAGNFGLGNAANFRCARVMADIYNAAGIGAIDKNYITGDFGVPNASGNTLLTYEPRVTSLGNADFQAGDPNAAGRGFWHMGSTPIIITDTGIDGFVIEIGEYTNNSTITFTIDGAAPASMSRNGVPYSAGTQSFTTSSSSSAASRIVVKAASVGSHTLRISSNNPDHGLAIVHGINSTTSQISLLTYAACGQRADAQAASDVYIHLKGMVTAESPALVVITSGTNDMIQGVSKSSWLSSVASLVANAQGVAASVLLEFPHAFSNVADATTADWNASLKAYGATNNLSVLSQYDLYGPSSGMAANLTWGGSGGSAGDSHPTALLSAQMAQRRVDAIRSM